MSGTRVCWSSKQLLTQVACDMSEEGQFSFLSLVWWMASERQRSLFVEKIGKVFGLRL